MKIVKTGVAGTMESSDIIIRIEPKQTPGIELSLESNVIVQFGDKIKEVILKTLDEYDVERAYVYAVDKGALDCTISARVKTAVTRAADVK